MHKLDEKIKQGQFPLEVLKDEIKLKIIKILSIKETCEYELMYYLNVKKISEHMKVLEEFGIVKKRREGLRLFYSLTNPEIGKLVADVGK
ncbi:MAG: ArsR family transcriptional regulator [Nitrososphaerales archaeon]